MSACSRSAYGRNAITTHAASPPVVVEHRCDAEGCIGRERGGDGDERRAGVGFEVGRRDARQGATGGHEALVEVRGVEHLAELGAGFEIGERGIGGGLIGHHRRLDARHSGLGRAAVVGAGEVDVLRELALDPPTDLGPDRLERQHLARGCSELLELGVQVVLTELGAVDPGDGVAVGDTWNNRPRRWRAGGRVRGSFVDAPAARYSASPAGDTAPAPDMSNETRRQTPRLMDRGVSLIRRGRGHGGRC